VRLGKWRRFSTVAPRGAEPCPEKIERIVGQRHVSEYRPQITSRFLFHRIHCIYCIGLKRDVDLGLSTRLTLSVLLYQLPFSLGKGIIPAQFNPKRRVDRCRIERDGKYVGSRRK
jgi:hypothetical protein